MTTPTEVARLLAAARRVVVVPGFGVAAAQAHHELAALGAALAGRGVEVTYALHPVAGRLPGHLDVLLAEAGVPYAALRDLETAGPELSRADVALVVGAADVVNPAARRAGTALSGLPVLDVEAAGAVVVVTRSTGTGYTGTVNELLTRPGVRVLRRDAREGLRQVAEALLTGAAGG